ncbi:MAG: hypothetical protein LC798_11030 [Chloroflexi bacterium]|nr:hypothetical protein [Chloroflexota bacterium]
MNIDTDDLLLFGSLALVAVGSALVVAALTEHVLLACGTGMIGFGLPTALITLLAARETP